MFFIFAAFLIKEEFVLKNLRLFLSSIYIIEIPPEEGGLPPQYTPPTPPEGGFSVLINNGAEYTDNPIVILNLRGGPNTEKMAISNFPDFRDAEQENYSATKEWNLCKGLENSDNPVCNSSLGLQVSSYTFQVFAKFYAPWGTASNVVSDSIIYKKEKPIIEMPEIIKKIPEILKPKPPEEVKPPEEIKPPEVPVGEEMPTEMPPAEKIGLERIIILGLIILILIILLIVVLILKKRI